MQTMFRWCCGVGWFLTAGTVLLAQSGDTGALEAQIRKAVKDPAALLVVLDVADQYHVFAGGVIGEIAGNKITLKAGSYTVGNVKRIGGGSDKAPPQLASELVKLWKQRPGGGNRFMQFVEGVGFSGEVRTLKQETTLELKRLVLASKQE